MSKLKWLGVDTDDYEKPKSKFTKRRTTRHQSKEQEKRVASQTGAKLQPGSGSFFGAKGDLTSEAFLIECKTTDNQSISLKRGYLDKISAQAFAVGKEPAMVLSMAGNFSGYDVDWMLVPLRLFERIKAEMQSKKEAQKTAPEED